jgi:predicted permease
MLAARIFTIVFPVFAIVAVGYLYGRWRKPDLTAANHVNMTVLLPALLFDVLAGGSFDFAAHGALAAGAAAVVIGSGPLAWLVARAAGVAWKSFVPPMMFTNAGNMGLPLAVFAFAESALPAAVVLFIVENGLHFTLGAWLMDHRVPLWKIARQPIVVATLAGIGFAAADLSVPKPLGAAIGLLGQASIPLLLFSLGARLTNVDLRQWRIGLLGAIACPLIGVLIVLAVRPFLDLTPLQSSLLLMFGALPPAVLNYLVAEQYRQEPAKVAAIVLLGNAAAVVTIPIVLVFALA